MKKKYKLIRSRLLLPLDETVGLSTRIEDGYVLAEGSLIREVGKYDASIRSKTKRCNGHSMEQIVESINRTSRGWF